MNNLFEQLYKRYNRLEYLSPDPLMLVLQFEDRRDREAAALISALFALGRVELILDVLRRIFAVLPRPADMLERSSPQDLRRLLPDIYYRFFSRERIIGLLSSIGGVYRRYGSLEAAAGRRTEGIGSDVGALHAMDNLGLSLREALTEGSADALLAGIVFPRVNKEAFHRGGAAKRLMLFLRWMVRKDSIDPGGWELLRPRQLFYPLDTHMMDISGALGVRSRKTADMATVMEITRWFASFEPDDPVRYDFCLTRLGIHPGLSKNEFINTFSAEMESIGHKEGS